jgi:zinc transport system substrate-binding protein
MKRRSFLGALSVLALTPSCNSCRGGAGGAKPRVAVSIFPLYDLARRLGGDKLDVVLVLPAGRTEHSYDPTPKEMQKLAGSKLAVAVGLDLDTWLEKIVQGAAGENITILQVGPSVQPLPMGHEHVGEEEAAESLPPGEEDDDHHGGMDPHFWLDPVRMAMIVDPIVDAFAKVAPNDAAYFKEQGTQAKKSLGELHDRVLARSKTWTRKSIVTFHGSFGYFAARYGLTIAAVVEPFPGKEPTPKYLNVVLAEIEKSKPAALFSEPQLDRRPAQVIADQSKLPLFELDPVGGSSSTDTYEKLVTFNADVLEGALK